jgi:hypothetical protein
MGERSSVILTPGIGRQVLVLEVAIPWGGGLMAKRLFNVYLGLK